MISFDTNVLLYAFNADCPEFDRARAILREHARSTEVVICELVLVELYLLLRNPAVVERPLGAKDAVDVCDGYRTNLSWRLVDSAPVMDVVWRRASDEEFARRRIIDARLALTLRHHGVTQLVTRNASDFKDFGFERVWNPFD